MPLTTPLASTPFVNSSPVTTMDGQENFEELIKRLYEMARENPDDEDLQAIVELIKFLRRSRGSLQSWNHRYRSDITNLQDEVNDQMLTNESLQQDLLRAQQEMQQLALEKQRLAQEREKIRAELKEIDREVKVAAAKVRSSKSLYGKFSIVWNFLQSTFFSDDPQDFGKIEPGNDDDPDIPPSAGPVDPNPNPNSGGDKPWMSSSRADIQRDLLDR
ncbi:conserved hypothetical protein (plasmid) [Picosynechococcus sp. PCC 7002]|nr:conserved hypothetical protein [Picosynechococcus sp. PCC 7002]